MSIKIIAEAGVNHNGSLNLAKNMAEVAKTAGADYVKYQTFLPEKLASKGARKAEYQQRNTGGGDSQLAMLNKLSLSFQEFELLSGRCRDVGIGFLSTPFDRDSLDFLHGLNLAFWKIPSGEVTNLPYLIRIAKTRMPVVMSTGMCEMAEIEAAIRVLNKYGAGDITLLHCNTGYPTPFEDVNLRAMETLKNAFGLPVGYSDHTPGIEIPIAAAALGAVIIEKHFTLDRNMEGPDHKASLEPDELKQMVSAIRNIETALGNGSKVCSPSETKNREVARKSIVAAKAIQAGESFTEDNITVKRPGNGISPMKWFEVLGQCAKRSFEEDELIEL